VLARIITTTIRKRMIRTVFRVQAATMADFRVAAVARKGNPAGKVKVRAGVPARVKAAGMVPSANHLPVGFREGALVAASVAPASRMKLSEIMTVFCFRDKLRIA
jgi:hypothetical protein